MRRPFLPRKRSLMTTEITVRGQTCRRCDGHGRRLREHLGSLLMPMISRDSEGLRSSTCACACSGDAHEPTSQAARHGFTPVARNVGGTFGLVGERCRRRSGDRQAIRRLCRSNRQPRHIMLGYRVVLVHALLRMTIRERSPLALRRIRFPLSLSHPLQHLTLPLRRDPTDHRVHPGLWRRTSHTNRRRSGPDPILHDRPPMNTSQKTLDDAKRDESSDIDPPDRLRIVDSPLVDGDPRSQCGIQLQEDGPRGALVV